MELELSENDVVEITQRDIAFAQAVVDGQARETGVVLLAGESLFLSGGQKLTVSEECRGTVMIVSGYAKYVHGVDSNRPRVECVNVPAGESKIKSIDSLSVQI